MRGRLIAGLALLLFLVLAAVLYFRGCHEGDGVPEEDGFEEEVWRRSSPAPPQHAEHAPLAVEAPYSGESLLEV